MEIASSVVGIGPSCRGTTFGGVRTASHTRAAPFSARSARSRHRCCRRRRRARPCPGTASRWRRRRRAAPRRRRSPGPASPAPRARRCTRGEHDLAHLQRLAVGVRLPGVAVLLQAQHRGLEARGQAVVRGVVGEVGRDVVLGHPAAEPARHAQAGQGGLRAGCAGATGRSASARSPRRRSRSPTRTSTPRFRRQAATASPAGPAPTTSTSASIGPPGGRLAASAVRRRREPGRGRRGSGRARTRTRRRSRNRAAGCAAPSAP